MMHKKYKKEPGNMKFLYPERIGEGCRYGQNWYRRKCSNVSGLCGDSGCERRSQTIGIAKPWHRDGDWLCPNMSCRNINFAFRSICNLCRAARPTSVSGTGADGGTSQMVTVRMTIDDLEKWYQFKKWYQVKGTKLDDKKICEAAAVSAKHCSNISTFVGSDRKGAPWLIDSGASRHMAGYRGEFDDYVPELGNQSVKLADGSAQAIMGSGKVICNSDLSLLSVLHIPTFPINLLSISCITRELNCAAIFFPSWCIFQELGTGKKLGMGSLRDGLYYLDKEVSPSVAAVLSSSPLQEFLLQHRRLGHMSFATLGQLYPDLFNKVKNGNLSCDACQFGKQTRSSYMSSDNRSGTPLEVIHSDVWGPSGVLALNGYRSFVTFIDCCTRVTWVYVLRNKSDVFECFKDFHKLIMTQYGACVKIFRTDNGTEYVNGEFDEYLSSYGIIHQTTCPGTSEQNGVAERKNRHLLEVTRCLMMAMNVPKFLWSEAVMTAAYLINRMPSRVLGYKAPIECLTGEISYVVPPKVFGCVCFVKDYRPSVSKLDPRALKCVFVGYSGKQKGYKCWCPSERRMFVSMDVVFREHEPFYGEPTNLSDVFPDLFADKNCDVGCEIGGDKEETNEATSRKMIVGVIPAEDEPDGRDEDTSNADQDHTQGEQQEYQTEGSRWPQNLQVYSRRQRAEGGQVQGEEETPLSQNPEDQVQPDLHDSTSNPSTSDGSKDVPQMERCHAGRNGST